MEDELWDGNFHDDGSAKITWEPWKKKFAIFPKKLPIGNVWFKSYYERKGRSLFAKYRQRGTLLDVIKEQQ